ncbi:benzoate 4-monooxygenase cytochrome p450 [Pyrenophora teres f. teres]|uniref:Benzoate 4-monooxygenase cytochrome p450 n=1 Tax=Pyrenophora teres f. teres TaxID=97479 RepID=A0A6S6VZN0_9PLEO|nr:benzoate 4-monooxygenase cytochrome p450 [Pyrenophora teres f. teres]
MNMETLCEFDLGRYLYVTQMRLLMFMEPGKKGEQANSMTRLILCIPFSSSAIIICIESNESTGIECFRQQLARGLRKLLNSKRDREMWYDAALDARSKMQSGVIDDQYLVSKPYLTGIFNETLRLYRPVLSPPQGAMIAGRYIRGNMNVTTPTYRHKEVLLF